ncbi:unnamed protein product, partial [Rotaria sordida]
LETFSLRLSILFQCGQRNISTSLLLIIHAFEVIEHLLSNLDEYLLAKLTQEKNRTSEQPFRIRRIRLMKNIWQHLKITLEKNTFNNEEDALQAIYNIYCFITSVYQAYIGYIDDRLKPFVIDIWRMHRCIFDINNNNNNNTVQLKVHDHFNQTILSSFELICTSCSPLTNDDDDDHHHHYILIRSTDSNSNSTLFSLLNILPIFNSFNRTSSSYENFLQLKTIFNNYLNQNNQQRLCLLTIIPYLFKTIFLSIIIVNGIIMIIIV